MFSRSLFRLQDRGRDGAGAGPTAAALPTKPGWLRRQITPILESLSHRACVHPIQTLVFVALLASTTYISLLEEGVFWRVNDASSSSPGTDWNSLLQGSKDLCLGKHTGWKWQAEDGGRCLEDEKVVGFLVSFTFNSQAAHCRRSLLYTDFHVMSSRNISRY